MRLAYSRWAWGMTLGVVLLVPACGLSTDDYAWCADHIGDVNAHFLAEVYGGDAVFAAGDTPLKQRLRAYFANPASPPEGMIESEQRIADRACRAARESPLPSN